MNEPNQTQLKCPMRHKNTVVEYTELEVIFKIKGIQKRKIKTYQAQMTCDVDHAMVKSKALSNPSNPLQTLGSRAGFKNQFSSEENILV